MQRGQAQRPRGGGTRTSDSHPITLSWILRHGDGALGLCYCPGKKVTRDGVEWDRSLDKDLARLRRVYGVTTLVCLLNQAELSRFKLRHYRSSVAAIGLGLAEFPIVEMAPPDSVEGTAAFVRGIQDRLAAGERLAVHCRGGVGRAGLVAACTLLQLGLADTAGGAIRTVRRLRCPRAVESTSQERFVEKYARALKAEGGGGMIGSGSPEAFAWRRGREVGRPSACGVGA